MKNRSVPKTIMFARHQIYLHFHDPSIEMVWKLALGGGSPLHISFLYLGAL